MGEAPETPPGASARTRRLPLLVARTAGAVPGALAGGAVAIGIGLTAMPTTMLGVLGAALGAVAATSDAPLIDAEQQSSDTGALTDPAPTPPQGVALS